MSETPGVDTVIVAVPFAIAVTKPLRLTCATNGFDEIKLRLAVITCCEPSEYSPVTESALVCPRVLSVTDDGETVMPVSDLTMTATGTDAAPGAETVMVAVPLPTVVTNPVASTVATAVFEEVKVTPVVTAACEPSEY